MPTTSTSRAGPRDDATTTSLATSVTPSEPDPSAPAQQPGQLGSTGATGGSEADEIVDEVLAESLLQPDEGGGGAEVDSLEGQQPASPPLGAEQLVPDRDSVGGLDPDFVVAKTRPASYRLDWVRMGALWLITMIVAGLVVFGLDLLKRSRKG